jgi:hypothetical protein
MPEPARLPDVGEELRPLILRLPTGIQPRILARLERGAAERYRAWAASCPDQPKADGLRACAAREEEVAARVEAIFPPQPDEQERISDVLPQIAQVYQSAFAQRPLVERYAIQAATERRGAAAWRALATSFTDASVRETLLACAELEERSAEFLETLLDRPA